MNATPHSTPVESPLPIVAFTDLDDTLFSSARKHATARGLAPAAWLRDGSPVSFTDARQRALISWLGHCTHVVPVTARNRDAFRRAKVPFDSYVVLNHGATVLLPDGSADSEWEDRVRPGLSNSRPELLDAATMFERHALNRCGALNVRLLEEDDRALYLIVKHRHGDDTIIEALARDSASAWLRDHPGYRLHVNGNNLAILPPGVGKAAAVAHVQTRLKESLGSPFLSIGIGDSFTDAPFMSRCDFAIVPSGSQLARRLHEELI